MAGQFTALSTPVGATLTSFKVLAEIYEVHAISPDPRIQNLSSSFKTKEVHFNFLISCCNKIMCLGETYFPTERCVLIFEKTRFMI